MHGGKEKKREWIADSKTTEVPSPKKSRSNVIFPPQEALKNWGLQRSPRKKNTGGFPSK